MHSPRLYVVGAALLLVPFAVPGLPAQEPTPAPATRSQQQPPAAQNPGSSSSTGKHTHAHDFLIRGTVFQPNSLAFPGVRLRIRRAKEKKFRWETYTNSRGEFAVRVPQGLQYELLIHLKNFADQTREVDARSGISEDNVVFRMQATTGGKK
jgi:hypothetical protein